MKDKEKNVPYHNAALSDISGGAQKLLSELDDYLRELFDRLVLAEMENDKIKDRCARETADYIIKMENLNKQFKEEKASWSSKERSYESKLKKLSEENALLKYRLRDMPPSKIHYVQYDVGNIAAEAAPNLFSRNKKEAQDVWNEVKELREKIDNDYIEAKHLEDSIKEYTDEVDFKEAHQIFERLNTMLAGNVAWTKAIKRLKKFFKEKKKELGDAGGARTININGDHPTYNETYND